MDIINASTTIVQQLRLSDCTLVHFYRCMGSTEIHRLYDCERYHLYLLIKSERPGCVCREQGRHRDGGWRGLRLGVRVGCCTVTGHQADATEKTEGQKQAPTSMVCHVHDLSFFLSVGHHTGLLWMQSTTFMDVIP